MTYPIPAYVFLGLFGLMSVIQLIFAFIENQKLRRKQKFLCLLMLGLFALFAFPNEPLLYCGAFLGMIGDILVLRKKTFALGAGAFLLGHLCYIFEALWKVFNFKGPFYNWIIIVAAFFIVLLSMYFVCSMRTNHTKKDTLMQSIYFATLVLYIPLFAFAISEIGNCMYLALIGGILFLISDSLIVITHYGFKFKRYDFYIMFTYLAAELLIVLGFVLTLAH